jgi:hypothetical protein
MRGGDFWRLMMTVVATGILLPPSHTRGRFVERDPVGGEEDAWGCLKHRECNEYLLGRDRPNAYCRRHRGVPISVKGTVEY